MHFKKYKAGELQQQPAILVVICPLHSCLKIFSCTLPETVFLRNPIRRGTFNQGSSETAGNVKNEAGSQKRNRFWIGLHRMRQAFQRLLCPFPGISRLPCPEAGGYHRVVPTAEVLKKFFGCRACFLSPCLIQAGSPSKAL